MIEFLSNDAWQGLGVIIPIIIAVWGACHSRKTEHRAFRTKNSKLVKSAVLPSELIEGQKTTLYGKVREEVFPGPPNYESVNDGDSPEFYWILYTNQPISLVGRDMEYDQLYEKGLSCMFQLCLAEDIYEKRLDILGKYVRAEGEIFLGHTGHHNTKALLKVESIHVLK